MTCLTNNLIAEQFTTLYLRKWANVKAVHLNFNWLNDSWIPGFELVTREFELVTQRFELATTVFEVVTREFELLTRKFELVTWRFTVVTRVNLNSKLADLNL